MPTYNAPDEAVRQMFGKPWTDPLLGLVHFSAASWGADLRLAANTQDVVNDGDTYTAFPFEFVLPKDDETGKFEFTLATSNFDAEIGNLIEETTETVSTSLKVVHNSDPDVEIISYQNLEVINAQVDAQNVQFNIGLKNLNKLLFGRRRRPSTHGAL